MIKNRCSWPKDDSLMIQYHDTEWGIPIYDDKKLFEFIVLDSFQAGLSWSTILKKRENFRKAFDNFNIEKIALYKEEKIKELMNNTGIIRNNLKITATISNAICFINIQKEFGTFSKYIWQFVKDKPINNKWKTIQEIPARTTESDIMSKNLKKRGFKFVGSTICYAFMQASGMVNDHIVDCYRYKEILKMQKED
jgi:DNA-3-methyladenine glycosylase I